MTVQKVVTDRLTTVQKTKVALTMVVIVAETAVAAATAVAEENPIRVVDVNTRRCDSVTHIVRGNIVFSGIPEKLRGVRMQTSRRREKKKSICNLHRMSDNRGAKKHNIWIPWNINAICEGRELCHWLR